MSPGDDGMMGTQKALSFLLCFFFKVFVEVFYNVEFVYPDVLWKSANIFLQKFVLVRCNCL